MNNKKILEIIYQSIDQLNEQYPEDLRIQKHLDTPLIGKSSSIDSLGLVTLTVSIEDLIEVTFNQSITLLCDMSELDSSNPFMTVSSLLDHISHVINNAVRT